MIFLWGCYHQDDLVSPGVPTHNQRVPRRWGGDTTHKPATTMTPNQREASFAFDVERAIVFTKMILFFFRGLCRDNIHCYMKNIYCGLHRGNLYYGFRRENLYYGLDSENIYYGLRREDLYCGLIFAVAFTREICTMDFT